MFEPLEQISKSVYFSDNFLMRNNNLKYVGGKENYVPAQGSLTVYHYLRISNLKEIMNGKCRFESPLRWNDPFEYLFYQPDIQIGNKTYNVVCYCFTLDAFSNEEGLWKVHGNNDSEEDKTIIRAAIKLDKLCKTLATSNPFWTFYVTEIDYSMDRDNILKHYYKRKDTPYQSIEEYIKDLSFKRKAFKYENELRIFAVIDSEIVLNQDFFYLLKIKYKQDLVTSVTLPPLDPKDYKGDDYSKKQEEIGNRLRHKLKEELKFQKQIYQSLLYDIKRQHIMTKPNSFKPKK